MDTSKKQRIAVAGLGYVGLSLACLLARQHNVVAVEVVDEKVRTVNKGRSPIRDADIEEALGSGRLNLEATTDAESAYTDADWVIVATPTNYDDESHFFDTSAVEAVLDILNGMASQATVVIKSTIPVGYMERISKSHPNLKLMFSPEFLREGQALYDNYHPSRIVVGVPASHPDLRPEANEFARMLAEAALDEGVEQLVVGATEAEAIKLFANTYLALRVAYFNELDTYAESCDLDAADIIRGVGLDPRIGSHYALPSFGYGGYCLPKDSKQLLANYEGVPQDIIRAVVDANSTRKDYVADRVADRARELGTKTVGICRLAMKRGSDNFRKSAVLGVMERLQGRGLELLVFEPTLEPGTTIAGATVVASLEELKERCGLIVANRMEPALEDVADRVYTRDLGAYTATQEARACQAYRYSSSRANRERKRRLR